jgi:hypothetical protein
MIGFDTIGRGCEHACGDLAQQVRRSARQLYSGFERDETRRCHLPADGLHSVFDLAANRRAILFQVVG